MGSWDKRTSSSYITEDPRVEESVQELIDYMVELVSNVNPSVPVKAKLSQQPDDDYDSDIELIDETNSNEVENITCEVSFDIDMTEDNGNQCPVCGSDEELALQICINGSIQKVCSKRCADRLRNGKPFKCASCGKEISSNNQGYLPNFGDDNSVLCSEQCLLKYETENEPLPRCYHCKIQLKQKGGGDSIIYYWQTMEFCSTDCIERLQYSWGKKCAKCSCSVPQHSLGKYSVRFGNVIKQFCYGACLESYKKTLKVCSFCQIDLSGFPSYCTSNFGNDKKKLREFCDTICRDHYEHMMKNRNSSSSNSSTSCCQCQRMVEKINCIEIINRGQKFTVCGSFCLSAFKFSHNVHKIICESCYKFGWSYQRLTILHYSGLTKLFCSRKCLNMFVLKIRKIVPCLSCNVKKYNFDLIEKYDTSSGDSKLFCSVNCQAIFMRSEADSSKKEPVKLKCEWCKTLARLPYQIASADKIIRNFCNYGCVAAYQQYHEKLPSSHKLGPITRNPSATSDSPLLLFPPNIPSSPAVSASQTVILNPPNVLVTNPSNHSIRPQIQAPHLSCNPQLRPQLRLRPRPMGQSSSHHSEVTVSPTVLNPSLSSSSPSLANPPTRPVASIIVTTAAASTMWTPSFGTQRPSLLTSSIMTSSNNSSLSTNTVSAGGIMRNNKALIMAPNVTANSAGSSGGPSRCQVYVKEVPNKDNAAVTSNSNKEIIIKAPPPKDLINKMTMFRSANRTKAVSCKPMTKTQQTQTEESLEDENEIQILAQEKTSFQENKETSSDQDRNIRREQKIESKISSEKEDEEPKPSKSSKTEIKYIPVPVPVPYPVPMFVPVPFGTPFLYPMPLPAPIPFCLPLERTESRGNTDSLPKSTHLVEMEEEQEEGEEKRISKKRRKQITEKPKEDITSNNSNELPVSGHSGPLISQGFDDLLQDYSNDLFPELDEISQVGQTSVPQVAGPSTRSATLKRLAAQVDVPRSRRRNNDVSSSVSSVSDPEVITSERWDEIYANSSSDSVKCDTEAGKYHEGNGNNLVGRKKRKTRSTSNSRINDNSSSDCNGSRVTRQNQPIIVEGIDPEIEEIPASSSRPKRSRGNLKY